MVIILRLEVIKNVDDLNLVDRLRYDVENLEYVEDNYFINKIKNNEICVLACFIDNSVVGGVYLSNYLNSLYVEKVFVKESFQKQGIASSMIKYVINNKDYFEGFFNKRIDYSKLEPNSNLTIDIYRKLGYRGPDDLNIMRRRI